MSAAASAVAGHVPSVGSIALETRSPGHFEVRGALTFATARRAREIGLAAFGGASAPQQMQVDCSGIAASDSAGMTVLLDWLAAAKRASRSLQFANLPAQVLAIARISDVQELLEKGV